MAAVAGVTALDVIAARRRARDRHGTVQVSATITVNEDPSRVYEAWRDLERLPSFMQHLDSVAILDERRSHWVARAPAGTSVEWDAELLEEVPGGRLSWRSVEGATVPNAGSVTFATAPAGQGCEVRVEMEYSPPGGGVGASIAKLFGENPYQQVRDDLRRFKQMVETREVAVSDGNSGGERTISQVHQHPARPAEHPAEQQTGEPGAGS